MGGYVPWLPFSPSCLVVPNANLTTTTAVDVCVCFSVDERHNSLLNNLATGQMNLSNYSVWLSGFPFSSASFVFFSFAP